MRKDIIVRTYIKNILVLIFVSCSCFLNAANLSVYKINGNTANVTEISLETALHKILKHNLTAEILKYENKQADSLYESYQTKFSPFINLSAGYQNSVLDPQSIDATYGSAFHKDETSLSLGKSFKTGTTVIAGYKDTYTDYSEPSAFLLNGGRPAHWHSPALFLQVKQELLKNSFGFTDREQESILSDQKIAKELVTEYQISGLLVSGIFDYWSVAQNQQKLAAAESELAAYKDIHSAVAKNVAIGLYENYNLYQFNALIAGSEAKLAVAKFNYQKSLHKMLRNLNMSEVSGNALALVSVETEPYQYDAAALYKIALEKRADIRQARLNLESAKKQLGILKNQDLPTATLQWQGTGLGYDEKYFEANKEAGKLDYSNWETKLTVSKVLFDNDNAVQQRNVQYQIAQAELQLQNLENQVRDEVRDGIAAVQTAYIGLNKTGAMVTDSERYLKALTLRLRQGKISTVELKEAVDMMVAANNSRAEALTNYNMALLNLDLVTNTVFEKYQIDIKKTIKETSK